MIDTSLMQLIIQGGGLGIALYMLAFFIKSWEANQNRFDSLISKFDEERSEMLRLADIERQEMMKRLKERDDLCYSRNEEWRKVIETIAEEIRQMKG